MKLVLDTSVIVAGLRSNSGASYQLIDLAMQRSFEILATPALFLEYEEVVYRPSHKAVHQLTDSQLSIFLTGLADMIVPVRVQFQFRPQMQDSDDEMVLEAAINGHANAIVTHNVRDFVTAASRFDLPVWNPGNALKELRK